jgi:hypothetical protein
MTLKNIFTCTHILAKLTLKKSSAFTNSLMSIQGGDGGIPFTTAATLVWFALQMVDIHVTIVQMPQVKPLITKHALIELFSWSSQCAPGQR